MKIHTFALAVVSVMVSSSPIILAADAPPEEAGKPVASQITEVTVYADRARVTRVSDVDLPAGSEQLAFAKLPGWIDEGSVRVRVTPSNAAELLDVQVLKTFLARPDDEEVIKSEAAVQEIADQIAALDDEKRVLDTKEAQVNSIRVFSLDKLPKDAATRDVKIDEYAGVVKFVSDSMLEVARARRGLDRKRRDLQPELNARQRKLNDLRQRAQLEQRTVLVSLKSAAAGKARLSLTYMIPGATWEPVHELRTENGDKTVALASYGVVTQTTGEDWTNAAIALSTQRSTDTIRLPELEAMLVGGERSLVRSLPKGNESFKLATKNYAGQFAAWNGAVNSTSFQVEINENRMFNDGRIAQMVKVFDRLQEQRGTTAHFASLAKQTIRTDGRSVRVPIGSVKLDATDRVIAAPEVSLNAANVVDLVNKGHQPLLPGNVLLYVGGSFLGTTDIEFVAQGESFPLFMGVADQIKLSRVLDEKNSSLSWSGRRKRMEVAYAITVENLSDKPAKVELTDRVPVSETEDIRVLNTRVSPSGKPDNKGLVKWELTLAAREKKELRLEYLLDYPANLVARDPAAFENPPANGEGITGGLRDSTINSPNAIEQILSIEQRVLKK